MDVNFVANNNQKFFPNTKKSQKVSSPFMQSYCTPKKRKAPRGRPRKNNQDSISIESSSSQEYEYEENDECFNNKDFKMCSESSPISVSSQPKIRKVSENTMKHDEHRTHYFQNESQQSDEYINIDQWNNYENAVNQDNGIINLCVEDSEMCNSNYIDPKGGVILGVNNEFTQEYERNTENNSINLNYHAQPPVSEIVPYKSQHFFQNTNDFNNTQDYTIYNQNFKSNDCTSSEKNVFSDIYVAQPQSHQNLLNHQQYIPFKKSGKVTKISNADNLYVSPQMKNKNLKYRNAKFPRIIEVNNNISPTGEKLELSNTIEISDHSYSTPYANKQFDAITASNINLKNKSECFNSNTLQTKNPQGENVVNIFDDIQNIDLRCDISEEISSTLEEYFSSLDLPPNSDIATKMRSTSKKEIRTALANDWINSQAQKQWDVPFVPISGKITSMICPICDWLGKVSSFNEHVRKYHPKLIFKASNGSLSISINLEDIRKCANFSQQYFIEHGKNLYIIHFKYKYPDIIVPIILFVPQHGKITMGNQMSKFFLQVNNLVKKQEIIWSGLIECLNATGRPLDVDVFSNRKHGRFEISMRSLDLVPNDVTINNIPQYLIGCSIDMHIFIETIDDFKNKCF